MKTRRLMVATLVLLSAAALGQPGPQGPGGPGRPPGGPGGGGPPREDVVARRLYPPELIMSHQGELGIDAKQRDAILAAMEKPQAELMKAQWALHEQSQLLAKALSEPTVDEAKALAQADKVMELERTVKRTHLGMLIRIRNLLTEAQRAKLDQLREELRPQQGRQPRPGPPGR